MVKKLTEQPYQTPKGVEEALMPTPPRFKEQDEEQNVKTLKYGHTCWARGGNYSTAIVDEIYRRRNNNESIVITVTGPPGSGKTYFGVRFGQKLDPKFHINDVPHPPPNQDDSQIAFGREHLTYITGKNSPLKRDQVIVMDESHFGVGARSWQNADQQELTNYIAAIRSKGYVLIIVVLHTEMVDKLIRNFVVNYEFSLTKRGEATIYRRFFPKFSKEVFSKRLGRMELLMPDEDLCNYGSCLRCKELGKNPDERCETIRAIYERRKEEFLNQQGEEREEESAEGQLTFEAKLMEHIYSLKEEVEWTSQGNIDNSWIQFIAEKDFDVHLGKKKSRDISRKTAFKYPDIKEWQK